MTSRLIPDHLATASTSHTTATPHIVPHGTIGDTVFNLGFTNLPARTNWSSSTTAAAAAQHSPFVNTLPDPALIDVLTNDHRRNLVRATEFNRRQRMMEDEILAMAGLEASPLHANDMTFSPHNPLYHDFSPFIGTIPFTGKTNETLDSPSGLDGLDTPLFGVDDDMNDWAPLFTAEEQLGFPSTSTATPMEHVASSDGAALINPAALMINGGGADSSTPPPLAAVIPARQYSNDSGSRSPSSPSGKSRSHHKRASIGGINRRKPTGDLPPVQFDPSNPTDIKRARNTMAARKSRARRVEKMEELAEAVDRLTAETERLRKERDHYRALARQAGATLD